ncbi:ArsC family reductase [Aquisediminimonas sediminicola]|uniref:ArsC family reductase n=1 Tax=Alteraquisediminimonas sediminicola TaxID=2676787 RepID=UPI001C8E5CCA|nr:ArsC family reductase [Aquisediminimonas sediminicola]
MATTMYGIKNCDTIKKARAWLEQRGIPYDFHDYKISGIDAARLGDWCNMVEWDKLLNRSGTTYRKLPEHQREIVNEAMAIALMVEQPAMIKRPVLLHDDELLVGFKSSEYERIFA